MKNTLPRSKLPVAELSRRTFFGRAAAASGAVLLSSSIPSNVLAQDEGLHALCDFPVPIPHINIPPPGGGHFYFAGPVSGAAASTDPSGSHPEGRDPSIIFNFKGFVGQGDFHLTGTGTDLTTGQTAPYTFHADMRFMDGVFVGTDGIERKASFAFVWLDSLTGSLGPHSWDGGLSATDVFWGLNIPRGSAHANLDTGSASLHVRNLCVYDAFTVANSVQGVNRPVNQVAGIINSLDIEWSGILSTETANEPINQMRGSFVEGTAEIAATATTPTTMVTALSNGHGFSFVSDPASTSVSNFALVGMEQNGIYF